jgi:glycerol-3-phosphate dehydrogenase (NAD(P)+)
VAGVRFAILGAGNLGTTLALVLAGGVPGIRAGKTRSVVLWTIESDVAAEIADRRQNSKYLPGVPLPRALQVTTDLAEALLGAHVILLALPSKVVREVARRVADLLAPDTATGAGASSASTAAPGSGPEFPTPILIGASKGLEPGSFLRMSQVIGSELPPGLRERILVISGPSIAHELSRGVPTAVVLAHHDTRLARAVRRELQTPILRIQISRDVTGVELGGVLKNAYALILGLCDGLGLGLNTKAALLTRALPEMTRFGVALGGRRATFYGLAGLGDLIGTGLSEHSRNRRMGEEVAHRRDRDEALAAIPSVVEGVGTLALTRDLAARHNLRLPILEGIAAILEHSADPHKIIGRLVG